MHYKHKCTDHAHVHSQGTAWLSMLFGPHLVDLVLLVRLAVADSFWCDCFGARVAQLMFCLLASWSDGDRDFTDKTSL